MSLYQPVLPLPGRGEPSYELRARAPAVGRLHLEIRQMPSAASPQLSDPLRLAGLAGRVLELLEPRILKQLSRVKVDLGGLLPGTVLNRPLGEDMALQLALLFRIAAPMRSGEAIRMVAEGIETMGREEAAYWLGMTLHRPNPRRVLAALRLLLTEPSRPR